MTPFNSVRTQRLLRAEMSTTMATVIRDSMCLWLINSGAYRAPGVLKVLTSRRQILAAFDGTNEIVNFQTKSYRAEVGEFSAMKLR